MQQRKNWLLRLNFTLLVNTQKCLLEPAGDNNRTQAQLYECGFWCSNAIFYGKGSQLWAFISQAILGKNQTVDWDHAVISLLYQSCMGPKHLEKW